MALARSRAGPIDPSWVVAIYRSETGGTPVGAGVCIDRERILTARHVVTRPARAGRRDDTDDTDDTDDLDTDDLAVGGELDDLDGDGVPDGPGDGPLWVGFPEARASTTPERRRIVEVVTPTDDVDVALVRLDRSIPAGVRPARLRCPSAQDLVDLRWWALGYPHGWVGDGSGARAQGRVAASTESGWVRLDGPNRSIVSTGFGGAGVWSPDYADSVVAIVGWNAVRGDAQGLSIDEIDRLLPGERLRELTRWSAGGEGLHLVVEPPFHGRAAAIDEVMVYLERPQPDGRPLVVVGAAGAGKSALLRQVVTTADVPFRAPTPDARALPPGPSGPSEQPGQSGSPRPEPEPGYQPRHEYEPMLQPAGGGGAPHPREAPHALASERRLAAVGADTDTDGRQVDAYADGYEDAYDDAYADEGSYDDAYVTDAYDADYDEGDFSAERPGRDDDHDDLGIPEGSVAVAVQARGKTAVDVATEIATSLSLRRPRAPEDLLPRLQRALRRSSRTFNVVIDGLDEAAPGEARAIATELIRPLAQQGADVGIQVVVGTRQRAADGDLLALLGGPGAVHQVDLDKSRFYDESALVAHVWTCLSSMGGQRAARYRPGDPAAVRMTRRIAGSSGTNFLVAGLIARAHGLQEERPSEGGHLGATSDLGSALDQYVQRIPPIGSVPARDVLTALAFAENPGFDARLWAVAVGTLYEREVDESRLVRFARSGAAGSLVEEEAGPDGRVFRLLHQALADTLRKARTVPAHRDEASLAQAFHAEGQGRWDEVPEYLLRQLPVHAARGRQLDRLLNDPRFLLHTDLDRLLEVADRVQVGRSGEVPLRLIRDTVGAAKAGPGERAALFGLTDTVEELGVGGGLRHEMMPYALRWIDRMSRREPVSHTGHRGAVNALCAVPAGKAGWLVSGGVDGSVHVWDAEGAHQLLTLSAHDGEVTALCTLVTHDTLAIVSGGKDGAVKLWDADTGSEIRTWSTADQDQEDDLGRAVGIAPGVTALCAVDSPGGPWLATGDSAGWVHVWDPNTGAAVMRIPPRPGMPKPAVTALCHVRTNRANWVVAGWDNGFVSGWDLRTGRQAARITQHEGAVTAVTTYDHSRGKCVASAGSDGFIVLYLVDAQAILRGMPLVESDSVGKATALCEAAAPRGRTLIAGDEAGYVWTWNPSTGERSRRFRAGERINALCTVKAGRTEVLATAGSQGIVRVWDPATSGLFGESAPPRRRLGARLGRGPKTGPQPVVGIEGGEDPSTGGLRAKRLSLANRITSMTSASQGGQHVLVAGSEGGTVHLRHLRDGDGPLEEVDADIAAVAALALGDQARILAGSSNGLIQLRTPMVAVGPNGVRGRTVWDWIDINESGAAITALSPFRAWGQPWLISGNAEGEVTMWDALSTEAEWPDQGLRADGGKVTALGWVRAGEQSALVSSHGDGKVHVRQPRENPGTWSHTTWEAGHPVTALCGVWSHGRRLLATAAADGSVSLHDMADGDVERVLTGHAAEVTSVCEVGNETERWLATGSSDRSVRLWDPHTGRSMWRLPIHTEVRALTAVGQLLLVGTQLGVAAFWVRARAPRGMHPPSGW
jgi:WD40 repeat protein